MRKKVILNQESFCRVLWIFVVVIVVLINSMNVNAAYSNTTYQYHDYWNSSIYYYAVERSATHTSYSATAVINTYDHSDPNPNNIHTTVTAKAFNTYGDLYGTASTTGNLSCTVTCNPGPGVSQCINVSSINNSRITFSDVLAE